MKPLLAMILCAVGAAAQAGEVTVAVAANFAAPLERIVQRFTAVTGHTVKTSVGSTGRLYSQVVHGAPFELLLAADDETPARLVAEGRAAAAHRFTYAVGRLVLWSANPDLVDAGGEVLAREGWHKLAIANPKLAPYGQAAMAVLQARGLAERLAPKLVMGDSIAQTWQFVATGNADLGFVALSQLRVSERPAVGSSWIVPASMHPEIRQDVVLLRAGEANPAAVALLAFLRGDEARRLIADFGYALPAR